MDDVVKGVKEAYVLLNEGIGATGVASGELEPDPGRDRSDRGSDGHNRSGLSRSIQSERDEQRQVKIRAYKRRWKTLKEELYGTRTLAEKKKSELEALKLSLVDVERGYYNLLQEGLSRVEEEELTKIKVNEVTYEMDQILISWKRNVYEALDAKILHEKVEDEARKQKILNAKDILKSIKNSSSTIREKHPGLDRRRQYNLREDSPRVPRHDDLPEFEEIPGEKHRQKQYRDDDYL